MHITKPFAGTSHASLYLVKNQQCIVFIAQSAYLLQIFITGHMHTALTLNGLQEYSAHILIHHSLQRFDIGIGHQHMAGAQRAIANVIIVMSGCCQSIKGAAVEGFICGNNFILGGRLSHAILTRQLHRTLIALGTAVSEENAVHTSGFSN